MMPSETLNELLRPRVLVQRFLWVAVTATVWLYVLLAYFLTASNVTEAPPINAGLSMTFYVLAAGTAIISFFLRRLFLSNQRIQTNLDKDLDLVSLAINAQTGQVDEAKLAKIKTLRPAEVRVMAIAARYFTALLLSLALNELIAVYGLILCLLGNKFESIIPFAIAATLLNVMVFPRFNKFIERNMAGTYDF